MSSTSPLLKFPTGCGCANRGYWRTAVLAERLGRFASQPLVLLAPSGVTQHLISRVQRLELLASRRLAVCQQGGALAVRDLNFPVQGVGGDAQDGVKVRSLKW